MAKIQKLDPHVADLIAAGEVVERPGSVVKELMENSIDAGALSMTVEIKSGGMTYIRVTDDGCGISWDDAETAFLRHATSKLRDADGLEAIGTLGFRGEALAAIAAVAKVELLTRERGAETGTRLAIDGGVIMDKNAAGCPEGTTVAVRDLFFNTPARLKFMKNDRAEGANVSSAVLRCALSHPEVSVKYLRDGKEEFHTPGDGRRDSCIYSLLGRDFASSMLEADTDDGTVRVSGYVSSPAHARGNRAYQFFFVNGRCIRSKTLQAALEQAYRNTLFTGRFPACVLYIEVSPASVDVNVHPTKTEVKFLDEKRVFDGVYYSALAALDGETKKAKIELKSDVKSGIFTAPVLTREKAEPEQGSCRAKGNTAGGAFRTMSADAFRKKFSPGGFKTSVAGTGERSTARPVRDENRVVYQTSMEMPGPGAEKPEAAAAAGQDYRIIGEGLDTYIIVEKDESLFLIDKHAAHERIIFDRLSGQEAETMPQLLLSPVICEMTPEEFELLMESRDVLSRFGIDVDAFGEHSVAVRQVPTGVDAADIKAMLGELCEDIRTTGSSDAGAGADKIRKTVACKAAIKAGRPSEMLELAEIAGKVMNGSVKYCPHGRPVAMELSKKTLDRNFKRI